MGTLIKSGLKSKLLGNGQGVLKKRVTVAVLLTILLTTTSFSMLAPVYAPFLVVPTFVNDANGNPPLYNLPITLTNNAGSATPANFECNITINSNTYSAYEASNLKNICFQDGAGNLMYSWLQGGNGGEISSSTKTLYWVKLPNPIAASGGSVTIYMVFVATGSSSMDGVYTGAEPHWAGGTYGQYDNGGNVFLFYDNFKGTTLNAKWTIFDSSQGTVAVNNGVTITANDANVIGIFASFTPPTTGIYTDSYFRAVDVLAGYRVFDGYGMTSASTVEQNGYLGRLEEQSSNDLATTRMTAGAQTVLATTADTLTTGSYYNQSFKWQGTSHYEADLTQGHYCSATDSGTGSYTLSSMTQVTLAVGGVTNNAYDTYWYRVRHAPPEDKYLVPVPDGVTTIYQVTLAVAPPGAGTTSPTAGTTTSVDSGSVISISATANPGFAFVQWTSTDPLIAIGSPTSSSTTATIGATGTITAIFAPSLVCPGFSTSEDGGRNNILFTLNLGHNTVSPYGLTVASLQAGYKYEVDFTIGSEDFAEMFVASGPSAGTLALFYKPHASPTWNSGDSVTKSGTIVSGTTFYATDLNIGATFQDATSSSDALIVLQVNENYLASLGATGSLVSSITPYAYYGSTHPPTSPGADGGMLLASCTTTELQLGGDVPEFPLGLLLLAVPAVLVYLYVRRGSSTVSRLGNKGI